MRQLKDYKHVEFIAYLLILIGILVVGLKTFYPVHYHKTANRKLYVVLTDSMSPTIPSLSAVVVRKGQETLKEGDIITFKVDVDQDGVKELVTHRIFSIEGDLITTISDRTQKVDPWVINTKDVEGKVVLTVAHLGGLILGVQKVAIPILLLSMLLIVALLLQTLNRWQKL